MVKIKSKVSAHQNCCTITAYGEIEFNHQGIAEVEAEVARKLIKGLPYISLAEGSELPDPIENEEENKKLEMLIRENHDFKNKVKDLTKENTALITNIKTLNSEIDKLKSGVNKEEVTENNDLENIIEVIKKTPKNELQEEAKIYPKEEWENLNVKDLREYLIKKLKSEK